MIARCHKCSKIDLCDNIFFDLILFSAINSEREIREIIYNDTGNASAGPEMSKVTEYQLPAPGTCCPEG